MKFATQIRSNQPEGSSWIPQIVRKKTKREAVEFAKGINETGGYARVLKMTESGWQEVAH